MPFQIMSKLSPQLFFMNFLAVHIIILVKRLEYDATLCLDIKLTSDKIKNVWVNSLAIQLELVIV